MSAAAGGGSALQGRFSELDPSRLYALKMGGRTIFEFIVNHAAGKVVILSGKMAGAHLMDDDLIPFENPIFQILDIGPAPTKGSVKTAAYRNETAAERANAFIRAQAERATRVNTTNENNPYKMKYIPTVEPPTDYNQYIKYFGLENVPKNKLKSAVRRLNLFFKRAYNTNIKMNDEIFDKLKKTILPKIVAEFSINPDAMAFLYSENFADSARFLVEFLSTFRGNNSNLATNLPGNNMNKPPASNGTELENYSMFQLENNSGKGGSAPSNSLKPNAFGGERRHRRRQTKKRSAKGRRTRRSRN